MKATITSWDLAAAVIIIGFILIGIWALTKRIGTQDER